MSGKQARAARAEASRRFSEREVITVCAAQHELATREAIGLVRAYLEAAVAAAAKTDTPEIREQRLAEWQTLELVLAEIVERLVANFPLAVDAARSGRPAPQITIRPLSELQREASAIVLWLRQNDVERWQCLAGPAATSSVGGIKHGREADGAPGASQCRAHHVHAATLQVQIQQLAHVDRVRRDPLQAPLLEQLQDAEKRLLDGVLRGRVGVAGELCCPEATSCDALHGIGVGRETCLEERNGIGAGIRNIRNRVRMRIRTRALARKLCPFSC